MIPRSPEAGRPGRRGSLVAEIKGAGDARAREGLDDLLEDAGDGASARPSSPGPNGLTIPSRIALPVSIVSVLCRSQLAFIEKVADPDGRFFLQAGEGQVGGDDEGLPCLNPVEKLQEGLAPGQGEGPADVSDMGVGRGDDSFGFDLGQPKGLPLRRPIRPMLYSRTGKRSAISITASRLSVSPASCQKGWLKMKGSRSFFR